MLEAHLLRFALGLVAMIMLAQIPPRLIRTIAPWAYVIGLVLLFIVMFVGDVTMGAQRWLDLGVVRFQPSEIMKLAVPLACAWFLHERPLPPSMVSLAIVGAAIGVPTLLIAEQPDLGTALLVAAAGGMVILLAVCNCATSSAPSACSFQLRTSPGASCCTTTNGSAC
jgi:rod shape determining protein RodA